MTTLRYTAALLGFILIGCGGPSFSIGGEPSAAGASGDEDTAGAGMGPAGAPSSAGSGGQAGKPSAGSSGAGGATAAAGGVGGTSSVGGSTGGSATAGAAGLGTDGGAAGESGSGGTAGAGAGVAGTVSTAGSGPVEPSCKPSEAIRAELLPTTLEWSGLSVEADGACMDSGGGTCSLSYETVGYEDTFTKEKPSSFGMRITCDAPILCGCDMASQVASGVIVDSTIAFTFEASGDGYVTHLTTLGGGLNLIDESDKSACPMTYNDLLKTVDQSAAAEFVDGKLWSCSK